MEDGEVDLDPGWDKAPLAPTPDALPIRDLERPERALSGVVKGVPEFLRPGRAVNKNKNFLKSAILVSTILATYKNDDYYVETLQLLLPFGYVVRTALARWLCGLQMDLWHCWTSRP